MKKRFGIIGAGMVGPLHAEAIRGLQDSELIAVATTRKETAKPFAEKYGAKVWYTDYHKLIERDDIDIINICTPPFLHEEMTNASTKVGKNVIVEKPIAINLNQADKMIEGCIKAGVKLGVIFQYRFSKAARQIKEAIDQRKFGKLIMGDAYVKWFRSQKYYDSAAWRGTWGKEGGGALINQSIHSIDLLQWFMGPVESLSGSFDTFRHDIEVEDLGIGMLKFKSGAMGVMEGGTAIYPGLPLRLEIHGEKGTVIMEGDKIKLWDLMNSEKNEAKVDKENEGKTLVDTSSSPTAGLSSEYHALQIRDFIEAIEKDKKPLVDGVEGRKALEIVRAIYISGRTGKVVRFPVLD